MLRYVVYLIEEQHVHGNKTDLTKERKGSGVSARATARTKLQVKGEKRDKVIVKTTRAKGKNTR
jgi:hypothetical protein